MKVTSKINYGAIARIKSIAVESLKETADALETELKRSKTLPFDKGNLQNKSSSIDDSKKNNGIVILSYDAPYARRLYWHPEFNFQKTKNPNAGAMWFTPYISGNKKTYASKAFARIMKGKMR